MIGSRILASVVLVLACSDPPGEADVDAAQAPVDATPGSPDSGGAVSPSVRLAVDDASSDHYFGASVAAEGDLVVVGADGRLDDSAGVETGAVYVYERSAGLWTIADTLLASDGQPFDRFGVVSLASSRVLVGARGAEAAYVFREDSTAWTEEEKLVAPDGTSGDAFGASVSLSANTAVVGATGATGATTNTGAVYVWTRAKDTWTFEGKVFEPGGTSGDFFGESVALDGDRLLVSKNPTSGAKNEVLVFERSGTDWGLADRIEVSGLAASENAGTGLALAGDSAAIGTTSSGAHLFEREAAGWSLIEQIPSTCANQQGQIALDATTLVVGQCVFERSGSGFEVEESAELELPDGVPSAALSVAVSSNVAIVGTPEESGGGAAYLFDL